ncbi:MAG TPA: sn-glycerol-3-phosphate ABC transporter substrate-binding protein UgpB [Alphaproteobacteria bacterium]|nr:sn-glycerol-3-phosphate ABC transporter substrate-binding protein UgpB [Alphaproteobacteria bacterium]
MKFATFLRAAVAAALFTLPISAFADPIEIQWWHAMGGQLGDKVNEITAKFNASQSDYKVVPVFKGTYTETMTGAIAAFRAGQQPDIVQVFEVGTATMMAAKGAVYPVWKLMADTGEKFDPKSFLGPVYGYYSTTDGKLLSMPFNSSTPVFYWNKDLFKKAGLDPEKPPKTWPEVGELAKKLVASGSACGLTVQWQTWINLENFSAWHNLPIATEENGFGGLGTKLVLNGPVQAKHIQQIADWGKDKRFVYGGREGKPDPKFVSGECPMYLASSGSAGGFAKAGVNFGISELPYWPDVKGAPQNSIIGGATLWVLQGKPKDHYKGVAKFFTFLSSPEVQADWHQSTGYVPITTAAYELTKEQGFYKKFPGRDVAVLQLTNKPPTANSKGLRLGNYVQIRDVEDEELENVWAGKKTAKQALDDIVSRGNALLRQFQQANE